ncbi:MAG TPA: M48 family metalloprotease [Allosphingosinicella sp.]|nr:M48 family metalloprotease [Allosphingosinicella sp.]
MARFLLAAAGVALLGAAPQRAPLPTYSAAYEPRTVDERGMWMEADEQERRLRDSPLVIRDEGLNRYVRGVLCRTVGEERCNTVRIYVMEVPAFNAMMAPNGSMTVWSGLLLRVQNEGELGAVLGHEFAHFELRHSLRGFKKKRTASDVGAWVAVLGGLANTDTSFIQLALIGSMFKFDREQEQAADLLALQYLDRSPYPSSAASELWQHVMGEADATAVGRGRKPKQRYTAGFFDTHPTELNRALTLGALAAKSGHGGDAAATAYRAAIAPYLPLFLKGQVGLNDFGGSEYILSLLAKNSGWNGDLLFARGELYRLRGNPRDLVSAAQFYGEAIKSGYSAPEVHRNLGLSLLRSGRGADAKAALTEYLRLKPDAADAKTISSLMQN